MPSLMRNVFTVFKYCSYYINTNQLYKCILNITLIAVSQPPQAQKLGPGSSETPLFSLCLGLTLTFLVVLSLAYDTFSYFFTKAGNLLELLTQIKSGCYTKSDFILKSFSMIVPKAIPVFMGDEVQVAQFYSIPSPILMLQVQQAERTNWFHCSNTFTI